MKEHLQNILAEFATRTLARYRPTVIGITGSVGKTSTKEMVYSMLRWKFRVRKSEGNFNNEIGVPLTILGCAHYGKNVFSWCFGLFKAVWYLIRTDHMYPEILILEMGADHPGDIEYLARLASPHIAVITAIGEIPVHVEFFAGPEEVAKEKKKLIQALPPDGLAVINADDDALTNGSVSGSAERRTFGFDEHADARILSVGYAADSTGTGEIPEGSIVRIRMNDKELEIKLRGAFGKPSAYAAAAGCLVGARFGLSTEEMVTALGSYTPPSGRMRLIKGVKETWLIDDTYNSSPAALHEALDVLRALPGKRKVAVIGDMLELGEYTESAHRAAGDQIGQFADMLIAVGPRARFIAEETMAGGLENTRTLKKENIHTFRTAEEAGRFLDPLLQRGDLVLVKGSQAMRMERAVIEIMREPERAGELLVRQSAYWRKKR